MILVTFPEKSKEKERERERRHYTKAQGVPVIRHTVSKPRQVARMLASQSLFVIVDQTQWAAMSGT